jgi:hypothetical protein
MNCASDPANPPTTRLLCSTRSFPSLKFVKGLKKQAKTFPWLQGLLRGAARHPGLGSHRSVARQRPQSGVSLGLAQNAAALCTGIAPRPAGLVWSYSLLPRKNASHKIPPKGPANRQPIQLPANPASRPAPWHTQLMRPLLAPSVAPCSWFSPLAPGARVRAAPRRREALSEPRTVMAGETQCQICWLKGEPSALGGSGLGREGWVWR